MKNKKMKNKEYQTPNNKGPTNSSCNKAQALTSEVKKFIVEYHNKLRNDVASKNINWKSTVDLNEYFPFATNMMRMFWDNQLANQAQNYANSCKTEHSSYKERTENNFKSNESIFFRKYSSSPPHRPDFGTAISFWFDKIKKFALMKKNIASFDYLGNNVDSFVQIIWAETFKIGCGYSLFENLKKKTNYELYVCLYDSGLKENKPIYKASPVKKCKCPNTTSCGNTDYTSLCCPIGFCAKDILNYQGPNIFSRRK